MAEDIEKFEEVIIEHDKKRQLAFDFEQAELQRNAQHHSALQQATSRAWQEMSDRQARDSSPEQPRNQGEIKIDADYSFRSFNKEGRYKEIHYSQTQRLLHPFRLLGTDVFENKADGSRISVKPNKIIVDNTDENIKAALDIAQDKGWTHIKIKGGSREAQAELWFQANIRGFETTGYEPSKADRQRLMGAMQNQAQTASDDNEQGLDIKPLQENVQEKDPVQETAKNK